MLDIKLIRDNPAILEQLEKLRNADFQSAKVLILDKEWRVLVQENEQLRFKRNQASQKIPQLKGKEKETLIKEMRSVGDRIKEIEVRMEKIREESDFIFQRLPNLPHESVPFGQSKDDNKIVTPCKKIPTYKFPLKAHFEILAEKGLLDLDASAKIAGHGFYLFKGLLASLERALINYCLDFHLKKGFVEINPPLMVNEKTMFGTGQLPKFEDDLYKTREGYYLIPTSEVPVTNLMADKNVEVSQLPMRFCAYTPCFRVEAGRHGTTDRGIFRLHQFDKVEMVSITHPDNSFKELEFLRKEAESILKNLQLPFRTILLCSGDMGFSASKTYDLEVWSPVTKQWLETSSVSNCQDFQARRMGAKFHDNEGNKFVHTLNGSGLAFPRLMISLIENNQQKDGSIKIPKVLQPYLGGLKKID